MIVTYYLPPIHTQRNESSPWDGCWAFALAMGVDAATGGKELVTEAQVRWASANPDRPGMSDGGNSEDQLDAIRKLAPKIKTKPTAIGAHDYPTEAELREHLEKGGGAVLSGYQRDAPIGQRKYDPRFYDRLNNGHGIYVQGTGDKIHVHWLDPLIPAGSKPPIYRIADALRFCWGDVNKRIAILIYPPVLNTAPQPPPDRVRVKGSWWDYDITGSKAKGYDIGRVSRTTRGFTAPLAPSRIGSKAEPFQWGGRGHVFAKVADLAYIGSCVDLLEGDRITHLPPA